MSNILNLLDAHGSIIDSVSTEYEDSFTLETFGDLIAAYQKHDKCFLLARVQTSDPKQPTKAFYSYYDAYQLNKVLFQTQVINGRRFIHRLHVLNPLSNLDIIGDVLYFAFKKPDKVSSIANVSSAFNPSNDVVGDSSLKINTSALFPSADSPAISPLAMIADTKNIGSWTLGGTVSSPLNESNEKSQIDSPSLNNFYERSSKKVIINPGIITRFSVPISKEDLQKSSSPVKKGNRRAWSFMNSINVMRFASTLEDWRKIALVEELNKKSDSHGPQYDELPSKIDNAQLPIEKSMAFVNEFQAMLFATDSDYLDSAKTRQFFRDNALTADDFKLFEMPAINGNEVSIRIINNNGQIQSQPTSDYHPGYCCQHLSKAPLHIRIRFYATVSVCLFLIIVAIAAFGLMRR